MQVRAHVGARVLGAEEGAHVGAHVGARAHRRVVWGCLPIDCSKINLPSANGSKFLDRNLPMRRSGDGLSVRKESELADSDPRAGRVDVGDLALRVQGVGGNREEPRLGERRRDVVPRRRLLVGVEYRKDVLGERKPRLRTSVGAHPVAVVQVRRNGLVDLVELAKYGVTTAWNEWGEDEEDFDYEDYEDYEDEDENYGGGEGREDEDEGGEGEGSADGDYESIDLLNRPPINWTSPERKDFCKIDRIMFNLTGSFPWVCDLDSGYTPEGNEAAERLFPGDAVVVSSEWVIGDTPGEVRFKVCDSNGAVIGVLWGWMNLVSDSRERGSSAAALACILPHLRVTVWDLMPVSLRNRGVHGPKLSIRFDLEPIAAEELIAQTHALLEKDLKDRTLSSKGGE